MKTQELRALTEKELEEKLPVFEKELFELRGQARLGKIEKSSRIRQVRKEIARVKTILKEKDIESRTIQKT